MVRARVRSRITSETLPKNFFSLFKNDALVLATDRMEQFAEDIESEAKAIIREQRYDWEPLKEGYRKAKEKAGLDKRILMATKDFVNNGIGRWRVGNILFVGPKPGTHEPSGLSYQFLARIFEYGTWDGNIPARPLWRPLLSSVVRRSRVFKREYLKAIQMAAKRRARLIKRIRKSR